MKRAEKILAPRRIDPGLAADGGIDLRQQHVAADDDVVGALAERDIDRDGVGMFQGRGHRVAPMVSDVPFVAEAAPSPHSQLCKASMPSSTIFSCGTSRDQIVMSACR